MEAEAQEGGGFGEGGGDMADADGAVMRGALWFQALTKPRAPSGEAVAAVGVADLQDFAGDALALGYDQFEARDRFSGSSTTESRVTGPCLTLISTERPRPTLPW